MKLVFTPDELKDLFNEKVENHYKAQAIAKEHEMRVHFDGEYPKELIDERRPNEPTIVQDYRKKIFVPKTKPATAKIESALQKIRRSSDWVVKYPDGSFDRIVDGEKMQDYADKNYPVFKSLTHWAFSVLLRNYLIDANAVALVAPIVLPEENEYLRPTVTIFNSSDVIYLQEDYAVLRNKKGAIYGKNQQGKSFYVVTTQHIWRYDQINNRGQYAVSYEYMHELGILPAFQLGGIVADVYGEEKLYESRISGILPEFNEALREYSDLQAAKVLHLYPERWEYTQNECTSCKGNGKVVQGIGESACQVTCETCNGAGYVASGPYHKILVKPATADQSQAPTPPAGFVEKDVEIIKVQEQSINDHIYAGLSAINFEFLAQTPLNQSGTAKEVDRDELNTTLHSIAEDIVSIMDKVYYLIALYRYGVQYSPEEILRMMPAINVPERFDVLSAKYMDEQLKSAKDSKLSPAIMNALEIAYAGKMFSADPDVARQVALLLELDPLSGITEDDKMARLSNGGITKLDYIISSNIAKFVNQAIETTTGFLNMDTVKQKDIITQMAQAQIDAETTTLLPAEDIVFE